MQTKLCLSCPHHMKNLTSLIWKKRKYSESCLKRNLGRRNLVFSGKYLCFQGILLTLHVLNGTCLQRKKLLPCDFIVRNFHCVVISSYAILQCSSDFRSSRMLLVVDLQWLPIFRVKLQDRYFVPKQITNLRHETSQKNQGLHRPFKRPGSQMYL